VNSKFKKVLISIPIILIVTAGIFWLAWTRFSARNAAIMHNAEQSLKRDIAQELPRGSDRSRVQEFLTARGMVSTVYQPLPDEQRTVYEGASTIVDTNTREIEGPLFNCQIRVIFMLDNSGKMMGYRDKFVCRNPI
jgi:hypothetical protein